MHEGLAKIRYAKKLPPEKRLFCLRDKNINHVFLACHEKFSVIRPLDNRKFQATELTRLVTQFNQINSR